MHYFDMNRRSFTAKESSWASDRKAGAWLARDPALLFLEPPATIVIFVVYTNTANQECIPVISKNVHLCTCVYTYMYAYIYMYVCMYECMNVCICIYIYICMCVYICMYIYIWI